MRFTSVTAACLGLSVGLTLPAPASGQENTVVVRGVVRATNGDPIPRAEVFIVGTPFRAITGDDGAFHMDSVKIGRYWIGTRRIGYEPVAASITLERRKNRNLQFTLEALPATLSPVEVQAQSGLSSNRLRDFDRRRRFNWGHFVTRDDIERRNSGRLSWIVQGYLPWVNPMVLDNPSYGDFYPSMTRHASSAMRQSNCPPAISIDGGPPLIGWSVNDFQPEQVEALEVYAGRSSRIPMEFSHYSQTGCGLIVVWRR